MLQAKIHRLEHILELKDLRLQDIQKSNEILEKSSTYSALPIHPSKALKRRWEGIEFNE